MSDLRKKLASRLPPLPDAPLGPSGSGEGDSAGAGGRAQRSVKGDLSPLPWSEFFATKESVALASGAVFNVYRKGSGSLLVLLLHGGGYTGLTWAALAECLDGQLECQVLAPDLRGHGETLAEAAEAEYALSNDHMVRDVAEVVEALFPEAQPPVLLVGHSMGGALAVRLAASGRLPGLKGLGVIDVVEGTAMEALAGMKSFLRSRPSSFGSVEEGVGWCLSSGTVRSRRSARVSFPAQLRPTPDGRLAWRTELTRTEAFWEQWFRGLSATFLSVAAPKLLILAGTDRLDKEMMVGQMQGKFQLALLAQAGHAVHEDQAGKVAQLLAAFAQRHRLAQPKGHVAPSVPAS